MPVAGCAARVPPASRWPGRGPCAGSASRVADFQDFGEFVESEADRKRGADEAEPHDAIGGVAAVAIVGTYGRTKQAFALVEAQRVGADADEFGQHSRAERCLGFHELNLDPG